MGTRIRNFAGPCAFFYVHKIVTGLSQLVGAAKIDRVKVLFSENKIFSERRETSTPRRIRRAIIAKRYRISDGGDYMKPMDELIEGVQSPAEKEIVKAMVFQIVYLCSKAELAGLLSLEEDCYEKKKPLILGNALYFYLNSGLDTAKMILDRCLWQLEGSDCAMLVATLASEILTIFKLQLSSKAAYEMLIAKLGKDYFDDISFEAIPKYIKPEQIKSRWNPSKESREQKENYKLFEKSLQRLTNSDHLKYIIKHKGIDVFALSLIGSKDEVQQNVQLLVPELFPEIEAVMKMLFVVRQKDVYDAAERIFESYEGWHESKVYQVRKGQ